MLLDDIVKFDMWGSFSTFEGLYCLSSGGKKWWQGSLIYKAALRSGSQVTEATWSWWLHPEQNSPESYTHWTRVDNCYMSFKNILFPFIYLYIFNTLRGKKSADISFSNSCVYFDLWPLCVFPADELLCSLTSSRSSLFWPTSMDDLYWVFRPSLLIFANISPCYLSTGSASSEVTRYGHILLT